MFSRKTSFGSFFSEESIKEARDKVKGIIAARKSLAVYPVFLLYSFTVIFLLWFAQWLLG